MCGGDKAAHDLDDILSVLRRRDQPIACKNSLFKRSFPGTIPSLSWKKRSFLYVDGSKSGVSYLICRAVIRLDDVNVPAGTRTTVRLAEAAEVAAE
jgi:hypothetical protein